MRETLRFLLANCWGLRNRGELDIIEDEQQTMNWRKSNSFTGAFGHKPDCWLDFLVCPRRHLAVLPSQVRPNLFAGD